MLKRFAAILLLALAPLPLAAQTVVVHAGRLVTDASKRPLGPSTITIVDGRISGISEGLQPPPAGARLIDLSAKTVLPGLIDTHVHLVSEPDDAFWRSAVDTDEWATIIGVKNARITARAGFTTVRDFGAPIQPSLALRRAVDEGLVPGPRILTSGDQISIVGGHGDVSGFRPEVERVIGRDNVCTGPDQCAQRVREFAKAGAGVIKFHATGGVLSQQARGLGQHFTDAEMKAMVETAHGLGLKVAAHAHGARGIEAAARAGVDSIEHGTFADAAAIAAMKRSGTALVPTLMAFTGLRERIGKGIYTPPVEAKVRETLPKVGQAVRAARAAGVPVVFGTDSAVYAHGRNAEEFAQLIELGGMSPAEALASATTAAAKLIDLEGQVGRIAPGYSADLIAVSGDPLQNIRVLEKVDYVMVRGRTIE